MPACFGYSGSCFSVCADFKNGAGVDKFENVNLYQLMCHVMQLSPAPHNGSWPNVCGALADADACDDGPYPGSTAVTSWRLDASGFSLMIAVAICAALFDLFN